MIARFMSSIENGGISAAKKFLVQKFHCFLRIASRNDETKIQQRGALRNHANVDPLQSAKGSRSHARRMAQIIADNADDGLVLFDADLGKFSESLANVAEPRRIVYGQRDADFGTRQRAHRRFRSPAHLSDPM